MRCSEVISGDVRFAQVETTDEAMLGVNLAQVMALTRGG